MYKRINYMNLVEGQSYFLVPYDRLLSNGLATEPKHTRIILPDFIPESKKNTILFPEGRLIKRTVIGDVRYNSVSLKFVDLQSKGTLLKKSTVNYEFFGYGVGNPSIAFFSTVPTETAGINATLNMNALAASLGKVRLPKELEPCGGAGCAAVEAQAVTAVAPVIGSATPSSTAINDLFLWAINGDFGSKTLKSILKRKLALNELLTATISIPPQEYDSRFRISIPGLQTTTLYKTVTSTTFNRLCDLGPDFPDGLYQVQCLQSILDVVIYKYSDENLALLELLLAAGADPNLGVITACYQRKPKALNLLIQAGAQPAKIVLKYTSTKGEFITHPLLAATPCYYESYRIGAYEPWKASVLACVNLLLTGTVDGTGAPYEGEPIITDEILRAIAIRRRHFADIYEAALTRGVPASRQLLDVLTAIVNLVGDKQDKQLIEHLEPEGLLGQALIATRTFASPVPPVPPRVNKTPRNNNVGNRPLPPLPASGGFYRHHTRKNGTLKGRSKQNRRRGTR